MTVKTKTAEKAEKKKVKIDGIDFVIESDLDYKDFGLKKNSNVETLKKLLDMMKVGQSVFLSEVNFKCTSVSSYIAQLKNEHYKETVTFKRKVIKDTDGKVTGCRVFRMS